MKRTKKAISILLLVVIIFTAFTPAYAEKSDCYIYDINANISSTSPYISATFVPTNDRLCYNILSFGNYNTLYSVSIQKYANSKWITVNTHVLSEMESINVSGLLVDTNTKYRVKITSNTTGTTKLWCIVYPSGTSW
ncbi:hypothetical protein LY28_00329 [Ruminiclostridium sufflavum DSM 19573]|uniref:Uncharacterized protein n=1 Tax=Ruminiclostridium sufflavum DSM 19573 TaxID=1121337 RepID=A0A318XQQ3_9FIRM|nr:hypothetical protein [Ruminiclostridium sufflavum]PYG89736.1 hypothetical protein LY28_00329 [Ruminiclostridium sufflavum DSM 19573]